MTTSEYVAPVAIVIGLVGITWLLLPLLRRTVRWYWRSRLRYPVLLLAIAGALMLWAAYEPESQQAQTSQWSQSQLGDLLELTTSRNKDMLLTELEVLELVRKALTPAYGACLDSEIAKMRGQLTGEELVQAASDLCREHYGLGEGEASYRGSGVWIVTPAGTYKTQVLRDSEGKPFQWRYAGGPWLFDERAGRIINQP